MRGRKTKNAHKIKKLNVTSKTSYYIGIKNNQLLKQLLNVSINKV